MTEITIYNSDLQCFFFFFFFTHNSFTDKASRNLLTAHPHFIWRPCDWHLAQTTDRNKGFELSWRTFNNPPQSRMWAQVARTWVVGCIVIDDVPIIGPDRHSQEAKTEQTCKPSSEHHQAVPHDAQSALSFSNMQQTFLIFLRCHLNRRSSRRGA